MTHIRQDPVVPSPADAPLTGDGGVFLVRPSLLPDSSSSWPRQPHLFSSALMEASLCDVADVHVHAQIMGFWKRQSEGLTFKGASTHFLLSFFLKLSTFP